MVSIGSDGGLVGPNPEGGTSCESGGVFGGRSLVDVAFWSGLLGLGVYTLRSGKSWLRVEETPKPGPLGGVGVGCRLRRVIRFYRTLTTVWTCEAKKPRWPKIHHFKF